MSFHAPTKEQIKELLKDLIVRLENDEARLAEIGYIPAVDGFEADLTLTFRLEDRGAGYQIKG